MSARSRLRAVIDALEARYERLSEEAERFNEDLTELIKSRDAPAMDSAKSRTDVLTNALDEITSAIKSEAYSLQAASCRMRNALLPPIALPAEILAKIFVHACEDAIQLNLDVAKRMDAVPVLWSTRSAIYGTCYHWHRIVLATPDLWREIAVNSYSWPSGGCMLPGPRLISVALERSSGHTIIFRSRSVEVAQRFAQTHWRKVRPTVEKLFNRLDTLDIRIQALYEPLGILSSPTVLPNLRHLHLEWPARPGDIDILDLTQATALRSVSLKVGLRQMHPAAGLRILLPSESLLGELYLEGCIIPSSVIDALVACSESLRSIHWMIKNDFLFDRDTTIPKLILSHLEDLHLNGSFPLALLGQMAAPNLARLRVENVTPNDATWDHHEIPLSNTCLFPTLRHFTSKTTTTTILTPFIRAHESLEELCLYDITDMSQILPADSAHDDAILPYLQSVRAGSNGYMPLVLPVIEASRRRPRPFVIYVPSLDVFGGSDAMAEEFKGLLMEDSSYVPQYGQEYGLWY